MKQHSNEFKSELIKLGKEIDNVITYINSENEEIILHDELYKVGIYTEASILKSVMKEIEIESSVNIPLDTIINYNLGIKIENVYEYLDYGNFVVYKSEKNEDTNKYIITCYDKMLYSMKTNEQLNITYPCTLKQYLVELGNKIGLNVKDTNFQNYNMIIPQELFLGINYTYRDILDQLAQATGSIIIINKNDEIEVKYPTLVNDTIDENYLKDVNVQFGEKYGPINSIVLSRSAESDNVYLHDETSIEENGLCEIKIVDNQIMNGNDRSNYLAGIMAGIGGLSYYINDFESLGILYYDTGDLYNVLIGEQTYVCLMLNDEIEVKNGIKEFINTEMPEQSKTDYSKADKTDQRINQTYLMVDKQNQIIESVVSNVTEQNNKISQITQTVDELNSKISDIADLTISGETGYATVELDNINQSEPIMLKIHPIQENISYLYPRDNLYPSDTLYMTDRKIRFENLTTNEVFDYTLPDDLLYYSQTVYDEFYLDYESQTCQVTKKCAYNADGTVSATGTEVVNTYTYPSIQLTDGNYRISLLGYTYGYIMVRLMTQNLYTTQFATKAELSTSITQTNNAINLLSSSKVGKNEIINSINVSPEGVVIDANKISLAGKTIDLTGNNISITSDNFSVDKYGNMSCNNANLKGDLKNYSTNTGNLAIEITNTKARWYDWENTNVWAGSISTTKDTSTNKLGLTVGIKTGSEFTIGYANTKTDLITPLMVFDSSNLSSTPWVKNTATGTINIGNGSISIQNGFITGWSFYGISRTFNVKCGDDIGSYDLTFKNGVLVSWDFIV